MAKRVPVKPVEVPRWAQVASLALSLAGLAIAVYLTIEHYTTPALLACPETGVVNCQKVTGSPQSSMLGIPVAVLGLLFFATMIWLTHPRIWRDRRPWLRHARLGAVIAGAAFVLYLIYAELFVVDAICLWCTAIHAIAIALFAVVLLGVTAPPTARR
jgi:uncharacterized membrane protein